MSTAFDSLGLKRTSGKKGYGVSCPQRAFTLMEILIVIAVISILSTIAFAGIGRARDRMMQVQEVNAARYLINTFHAISTENGRLFSGVRYSAGTSPDAQAENIRYVTHMAHYTGEEELEAALYYHPSQRELLEKIRGQSGGGMRMSYIRSIYPALGMNSPIVGGEYYNDEYQENRANVSYLDEANEPSNLVVFVSTGSSSTGFNLSESMIKGYFKASSPYIGRIPTISMWNSAKESDPSRTGNVHFRWEGKAIAAMLDGSVRTFTPEELKKPQYWLNDTSAFN